LLVSGHRCIDHCQGILRETTNPLEPAIDGDGLVAIEMAGGIRYTRNGNFRLSPAGALTTGDGSPLRARGGGRIVLQPGLPIEVSPDGTVSQNGQAAGQIEMASFDPGGLEKMGANYFAPVAGARARPATGSVLQGKLEQSN